MAAARWGLMLTVLRFFFFFFMGLLFSFETWGSLKLGFFKTRIVLLFCSKLKEYRLRVVSILDLVFLVQVMFVTFWCSLLMVTYAAIGIKRLDSYEALPTADHHIQMKTLSSSY